MIIGCAGELNQCFVFNFDQGFITKFSLLGILYPISPDQQFLVMDKFQSALLSIFKRRQSVHTADFQLDISCPMSQNGGKRGNSVFLTLASSLPHPRSHLCQVLSFQPFSPHYPVPPLSVAPELLPHPLSHL